MSKVKLPDWIEENAVFPDPQHRIWLRRRLGMFGTPVVFILHNPSTANAEVNDKTVNRALGFAKALDASDLVFVNAATGIATDANDLVEMDDPIGTRADEALEVAAEFCLQRNGVMIAAWGAPKGIAPIQRLMVERFKHIRGMGLPLHYLRLTSTGYPEHPLYLPSALRPVPWNYKEIK